MDALQLLGSTLGISFLAGIRLYATVLALGLSIRFGWFHPPAALSGLEVLAHPAVLIIAGIAYAAEFVADKIPWFDTLWDSIHTVIRPLGAALLAASALGTMDPKLRVALAILCGGVALASHSSKAATRVMVNHSPEPFSNIALSLAGDVATPVGVWFTLHHPLIALVAVAVAVLVFAILARVIFRAFRSVLARLGSFHSGAGSQPVELTKPLRGS
jgi:hypothetical protein